MTKPPGGWSPNPVKPYSSKDLARSAKPLWPGTVLRLGDFDRDQILWLNCRHGSALQGAEDLERLINLIGGYPYLVRQALYAMTREGLSIAQMEQISAADRGPFGDHLRRHMWVLRENERLRKALKRITHYCCERFIMMARSMRWPSARPAISWRPGVWTAAREYSKRQPAGKSRE